MGLRPWILSRTRQSTHTLGTSFRPPPSVSENPQLTTSLWSCRHSAPPKQPSNPGSGSAAPSSHILRPCNAPLKPSSPFSPSPHLCVALPSSAPPSPLLGLPLHYVLHSRAAAMTPAHGGGLWGFCRAAYGGDGGVAGGWMPVYTHGESETWMVPCMALVLPNVWHRLTTKKWRLYINNPHISPPPQPRRPQCPLHPHKHPPQPPPRALCRPPWPSPQTSARLPFFLLCVDPPSLGCRVRCWLHAGICTCLRP